VNLGTCLPVSRTPEGKRPNLIVLVHGCCTDANGVREWDGLGGEIAGKIIEDKAADKWEIMVWDWTQDTPKQGDYANPFNPGLNWFIIDAQKAYENALNGMKSGQKLADAIYSYSTYKYIHLIGHSAGARLIDRAVLVLSAKYSGSTNKPFIHLTFLDAYTPLDLYTLTPVDRDLYGLYADYAEHYVDRSLASVLASTDACLSHAFNFDITRWFHAVREEGLLGHQWPRNWYQKSVTSTSPKFKYGFPLSFQGGNNFINRLSTQFPPGKQCGLDTGLFNETPNPDCQQADCWK
jgi:hypothetical protein